MPSAKKAKEFPQVVTLSVSTAYAATTNSYGEATSYVDGKKPQRLSGTGETLAEAIKSMKDNIEAGLSKNKDAEILALLKDLDI